MSDDTEFVTLMVSRADATKIQEAFIPNVEMKDTPSAIAIGDHQLHRATIVDLGQLLTLLRHLERLTTGDLLGTGLWLSQIRKTAADIRALVKGDGS